MNTTEAKFDNHYVLRFKEGDPMAFAYFFEHYWEGLYIVAYRHLQEEAQAKDLVQEVFIHIWEKRLLINSEYDSIKFYLHKALKNKILNYYATERVRKQALEKSMESMDVFSKLDSQAFARYQALEAIVDDSIDKLPKLMKAVYLMRADNYSIAQIAAELNLAEQTVKNYLSEAKKIMRRELTRRFADHDPIFLIAYR
ncbi:sigma-70 family RNA polymerase sigma factor [Sphingobacterium sp.]|uniref:RNA polymerase sigma factor n=1 Tax=Sphingobacterium sp. TaxID=341027 RepID=UPI0028968810|nr:sigma-70 family RNA polymerase sigma factor [Sphingobacterium sp.]